jgi:V8-like Glu-specific endopeptidase
MVRRVEARFLLDFQAMRGPGLPRLGLACVSAAVVALGAASSDAAGAGAPTAHSATAVRAYWTPARMRSALPAAALLGRSAAAVRAPLAKGSSLHEAVAHPKRKPYRTHGKVFFSIPPYDLECSGTSVKSQIGSLVLTAGHCSYDQSTLSLGGNAVRNWEFVPAYNDGHAPFGEWPGSTTATSQWRSSHPVLLPTGEISAGDLRFDVGAGIVGRQQGKTLASVVGARAVGFNERRSQRYLAIGYPAEGQFNGRREFSCDSKATGRDGSSGDPATIAIACDMTGGSSGGGWVDSHGRVVSVTSYSRSGDNRTLYGPYFGNAIRAFYNSVKGG